MFQNLRDRCSIIFKLTLKKHNIKGDLFGKCPHKKSESPSLKFEIKHWSNLALTLTVKTLNVVHKSIFVALWTSLAYKNPIQVKTKPPQSKHIIEMNMR